MDIATTLPPLGESGPRRELTRPGCRIRTLRDDAGKPGIWSLGPKALTCRGQPARTVPVSLSAAQAAVRGGAPGLRPLKTTPGRAAVDEPGAMGWARYRRSRRCGYEARQRSLVAGSSKLKNHVQTHWPVALGAALWPPEPGRTRRPPGFRQLGGEASQDCEPVRSEASTIAG